MRPALTPISSGLTCVRMTPSSIGVRLSSASAFLKITFSNPYARSSQLNRDSILNDQQSKARGSGPANDIANVEATSTDIPIPLETPWPKAEHIPCSRSVRVDVHKTIMLASIGGFRPGTYLILKYRRVKAVVARDPNSDKRWSARRRMSKWSNHVAKFHGIPNAPALPKASRSEYKRNRDGKQRKRSDDEPRLEERKDVDDDQRLECGKKRRDDKGRLEVYAGENALCLFCGLATVPRRFFSSHLHRNIGRFSNLLFAVPNVWIQAKKFSFLADMTGPATSQNTTPAKMALCLSNSRTASIQRLSERKRTSRVSRRLSLIPFFEFQCK
ncbi:hypothetical protein MGG_16326 [Pyricularia oryzae 70-15]|uniref:Uncharacterized protein n=2 Tax=Pyricularia oryzae TaxID=318829 RepID=G4MKG5_PYRO7|nr:uncharacterized protein MGG_16326 [Pyricularia oryzae 70-15]EHA57554.1 hypothetical protein MGG_16326 [Pyricularia oryzae 70-15]ELQ42066.1 hypothetical protein OOU_Y34scaffold00239g1 [Pyricularia oryzae Y34]